MEQGEVLIMSEGEDKLLKNPGFTGTFDDAVRQLSTIKVERPNLTTAQQREAVRANVRLSGEETLRSGKRA